MEILRLPKELEGLVENQKTLMGLTFNFNPDEILNLTNRIRVAVPSLLPEQALQRTENVLKQHIQSQSEISAIMDETRTAVLR